MTSAERHEARYQRRKALRDQRKAALLKEYGDFDKIFSFDSLYNAYKLCCKGVRWKASTQRYISNSLYNITLTRNHLMNSTYRSKGLHHFNIWEGGKPKEITSVHISERVVHRALCDYCLTPLLRNSFIYDNAACLSGKGIHFAINRLKCHLQRHYRKYGTEGYVLTFDFVKFFARMDRDIVIRNLEDKGLDERLIFIVKDLADQFGEKGFGLGSQISQISALNYPNKIDHYIKEVLKIKGYGRYMDDAYLIHPSKEYLQECLNKIKEICSAVGLELHPRKTRIVKLSKGMKFLKHRFNLLSTGKVLIRPNKRNITIMRRKLKTFKRFLEIGRMALEDIKASYISWRAYIGKCSAFNTLRNMEILFKKLFA